MRQKELERMPLDELWKLHEQVEVLLSAKLEAEARELEERLARLRGKKMPPATRHTRHYPKISPDSEILSSLRKRGPAAGNNRSGHVKRLLREGRWMIFGFPEAIICKG